MTFLPLIERELRIRSRQRAFYWWRMGVALLGAVFVLPVLLSPVQPRSPVSAGAYAFNSFVVLLFILCACAGVLTSSAIIREREEGTLGFLFLTQVNSFDIIIGALGSTSITCLCVLIAYLPVVTLPILAGGVSGGEAVRKFIVLVVTLCFGLVLGLWTSARGHPRTNDTWLPVLAAFLVIFISAPIGPAAALWLSSDTEYARAPYWFWSAIAMTCVLTAVALSGAIVLLRKSITRADEVCSVVKPSNRPTISRIPQDTNPIEWLVQRQRPLKVAFWTGALLTALWTGGFRFLFVLPRLISPSSSGVFAYSRGLSLAISALRASLFAWAASRFIFESRRNGALELIATTPVGASGFLPAHWAALKRLVKWPLIVMTAPTLLWLVASMFSPFSGPPGWPGYMIFQIAMSAITPIVIIFGTFALLWCAIRFALTARVQAAAVVYAVVLVQGTEFVVPQLCSAVLSGAFGPFQAINGSTGPGTTFWLMQLIPRMIEIGFFVWLYKWARRGAVAAAAVRK